MYNANAFSLGLLIEGVWINYNSKFCLNKYLL